MSQRAHRPTIGLTAPLSAIIGTDAWGIGEIPNVADLARALRRAELGIDVLQLLPITPMSSSSNSPYSSSSSYGIDPVYISVAGAIHELSRVTGLGLRAPTSPATSATRVAFNRTRQDKLAALRTAVETCIDNSKLRGELDRFSHAQPWVDDLAYFLTLSGLFPGPWWSWPDALATRTTAALTELCQTHRATFDFHRCLQWLAHSQWNAMRDELRGLDFELMGDLPFMVAGHSVDTWCSPDCFDRERSLGVPGDTFDANGQDWTLPTHRWPAIAATDDLWLRRRTQYTAGLFDRLRVDHAVGYFRTYSRAVADLGTRPLPPGRFEPTVEPAQIAQGRRTFSTMQRVARMVGCTLIAEDLGQIPDYVPDVLGELGIAGYRVLPWQREGQQLMSPASYPRKSVACFGTHDTESLAGWWQQVSSEQRSELTQLASRLGVELKGSEAWSPQVLQQLLSLIRRANSELVLLLLQDLIGSPQRLNTPGTVGEHNWTYRLPCPVEQLCHLYADTFDRVRQALHG